MAGVVFFFEEHAIDVYSGRKIDLDAWNYAFKAAGDIQEVIIVNRTDRMIQRRGFRVNCDITSALPKLKGRVVSLIFPWNTCTGAVEPLWDFDHEVDWYVFGPSEGWGAKQCEDAVFIPQSGKDALHTLHIASVVMLHRFHIIRGIGAQNYF